MVSNFLFDLRETQPIGGTKRHGGGIYGELVFFRMLEIGLRFSCVYDSRVWINPKVKEACDKYNLKVYDYAENQLSDIVERNKIERIYSPIFNDRLYSVDCDVFFTLHGLRGIELPADWNMLKYSCSFKDAFKLCVKKTFPKMWLKKKIGKYLPMVDKPNFHFATVSNHSKYSILAHFPFMQEGQIKVFYSPDTTSGKCLLRGRKGDFYLLVSGNRWEKNNLRAIEALDELFSDGRIVDKKVIVTGLNGHSFHYKIKNPRKFAFVGYVDDEKLNELYASCFAFIYPSLNEGFGYPPLEAMRYGKPVLVSPVTSISEVCADGASFFNPYDVYEIKGRVLSLENESIYDELSGRALKRYEKVKKRQEEDLDGLIKYITQ